MQLSNQAQGRWHGIHTSVGIDPRYLTRKHSPCPGCGGSDRFKWDDLDGNGTFYCGGGGEPIAGDGFGLIKHVFECDFPTAARMVEGALGIGGEFKKPPIPVRTPPKPKPKNNDYALSIWEKANTDDKVVAAHPYAQLKGINHASGAGRGKVSGCQVGKDADCIIVPLRALNGSMLGVEVIGLPVWDEALKKHVTPKQTFGSKGTLILGNTMDKTLPVYIVEGWADAASVHRKFGNVLAVAVFGNKQMQVAQRIERKNPEREIIIVEDA